MTEEGILYSAIQLPNEEGACAEYVRVNQSSISSTARKLLKSLPKDRHARERKSYSHNKLVFNCLTGEDLTLFIFVVREGFSRVSVFEGLDQLQRAFVASSRDPARVEKELRRVTDQYSDPNANKISKVKNQVEEVKVTMLNNIDQLIERGEKIDDLCEKTELMKESAENFRGSATTLRRKMLWKKILMTVGIVFVVLFLIFIVVLLVCRKDGINFDKCK